MDNVTLNIIQKNCIIKMEQLKNKGCSEEYLKGYMSAYIDGFEDGNINGMKKIKDIIEKL